MSGKKNKAERRGAARIEAVRPGPIAQRGRSLWLIRLFATLGLGIAAYLAILHYQAGAGGAIDSPFCGTGTVINCNAVLGSAYAYLFGQPVALWAAVTYAAVLVVSMLSFTGLLVLLCGWVFVFSLYMAGLSFLIIKSVCLFCLTLYAINLGLLLSAGALARSSAVLTGRQAVYSFAGYVVLILGLGWWQTQEAAAVAPPASLAARIPTQVDEGFIRYYNSRPVVTLRGAERYTKGPPQAPLTISEFVDFR